MSISVSARDVSPPEVGMKADRFFRDIPMAKKVNIIPSNRGVRAESVRAQDYIGP